MSTISKSTQEVFIGVVICVVLLTLYPNIHTSLLLSFAWMLFLVYKYGHKLVSDYLDAGISEIKTSVDNLEVEKNKLQKKIEDLTDEISISKRNYEDAIENAKAEAQAYYDKKMLEIDNTIKEIEVKNKNVLLSTENEYSELIKHKITDLIIENLVVKISDPKNVKNVTLTGISRAVEKLQGLRIGE